MIKRISFISCLLLLLVVTMAVPAFAAETDDFYFIKQPKDFYIDNKGDTASFVVSVFGDIASYRWEYKTGNNKWLHASWSSTNSLSINLSSNRPFYQVRCIVTSNSGEVITSDVACVIMKDSLFSSHAFRSIYFVISWVGTLLTSLVTPEGYLYPLLPILAIGIAVTVVLLVSKIFKSFSWGL